MLAVPITSFHVWSTEVRASPAVSLTNPCHCSPATKKKVPIYILFPSAGLIMSAMSPLCRSHKNKNSKRNRVNKCLFYKRVAINEINRALKSILNCGFFFYLFFEYCGDGMTLKRQQNQVFIVQIQIFEFREKWMPKISSTDKNRERDTERGVKQ